jgi:DNA-binding HxlR family transcriptional regulator
MKSANKIMDYFILGPVPYQWVKGCIQMRSLAVMKIAWALLFLRGMRGTDTVKLTGQYHSMFLISPNHMGERLRKMEEHGLIQIEELRKGVSPTVTLLLDRYYE